MRTNYFLLLAILLGMIPMSYTHANDSIPKSVILYTPYTKISVSPGASIDYSIDLINNTDQLTNANLSVSGLSSSWKHEMKSGGWSLSQLSVLPKEKKTFNLKVEVPLKVNKGNYHFVVYAGNAKLPLDVVVAQKGTYQTEFTTDQPNMQGNSKSTFTFSATLKNQTADQQLYALMANAPRGWNVVFKPNYKQATSAQVEANSTQNVSIDITPPANVEATFAPELQALAAQTEATYDNVVEQLTRQYDGYRFTPSKGFAPIYNPFSVLSALDKLRFGDYWFASGTPTFLVEILKKTDFDLRELDGIEVSSASLSDDRANISNPIPMIYQSGYLTIKSYDQRFRVYILGFPNEEVKYGFLNFAAPFYTPVSSTDTSFYIGKFVHELETGDVDAFLTRLNCFFADFPYELNSKTERHYQVVFYLVFKLMGQFTQAEVRTAIGRADAVVKTADYIYVFEFKLEGTAEDALRQIDEKVYMLPYSVDGRKLIKVGVSFDAEKRNLGKWIIKE